MEDSYIIKGGKKLSGEISLSGAKNVALKTIIAALLFNQEIILENIPQIGDVYELLNLIGNLGGKAEFIGKNRVVVDGRSLNSNKLDFLYASKIRVSFMLLAPLLYKFKAAYIPNPGGCRIGARPIDRIIKGIESLGIEVKYNPRTGYYFVQMGEYPKGEYTFLKPSHTGTETLILLSVLSKDKVVINNAAQEPEIDDLINFLNSSSAKVIRNGSSIIINGVESLRQQKPFSIMTDRNEAVTYAILALATQGEVILSNIKTSLIQSFLDKLKETGAGIEIINDQKIRFFYKNQLKAVDIFTSPYPGFMTDWQPPWSVLMTQAKGTSTIHERVFENRLSYVQELIKLGCDIKYVNDYVKDPNKFYFFNYNKNSHQMISITGPKRLHGGVMTIYDLRAGATLAIAALVACGESVINNASILERGYEDFTTKIKNLGGQINKI